MRQAEQSSAALGDKTMHRLISIEEARPGHRCNFRSERGRARPSVKRVVAVPQGKPLIVVLPVHKADSEIARHLSFRVRESCTKRGARAPDVVLSLEIQGGRINRIRRLMRWRCYSAARKCRVRVRSPPPRSARWNSA